MESPGLRLGFFVLQIVAAFSHNSISRPDFLKLLENYDRFVRPESKNGGPVQVETNMFIRYTDELDEDVKAIEMQITFRMRWTDSRLSYPNTKLKSGYVTLTDPELIWTPDVFFSNAKSGFRNGVLQPNILMRVFPDGNVLYSSRVTLKLNCEPEPQMFPLDKVKCSVIVASYGLTATEEVLTWKEGDPVQISKNVELRDFHIDRFITDYCTSKTVTGEYSCLKATLYYEREPFGTHFFFFYLPSLGLVLLSWLTFFINRRVSDVVRLTLTMTFVLLMALVCTSLWHMRPHYAFVTPADVWVFVSAIFVFYSMVHYVVSRFVPCISGSSGVDAESGEKCNEPFLKTDEDKEMKLLNHTERMKRIFEKNKADVIARFVYPVAYIIFAIVYTIYYKK